MTSMKLPRNLKRSLEELKLTPRIWYFRPFHGPACTLAVLMDEDTPLAAAVSVVHPKDRFVRVIGRTKAIGRALSVYVGTARPLFCKVAVDLESMKPLPGYMASDIYDILASLREEVNEKPKEKQA